MMDIQWAGMGFALVIIAVAIVISVFFFLTLYRALLKVHPVNRRMEPGLVWLGIVPLLNIVWAFMYGMKVPESLQAEFHSQRRPDGSDYGRSLGLTHAILGLISVLLQCGGGVAAGMRNPTPIFGILNLFVSIAGLVVFIMFWVKIAGYSAQLGVPGYYDQGGYPPGAYPPGGYPPSEGYPPSAGYPPTPPPPPPGTQGPNDAIRPDDRGQYR